jgi:hypothetical protein
MWIPELSQRANIPSPVSHGCRANNVPAESVMTKETGDSPVWDRFDAVSDICGL